MRPLLLLVAIAAVLRAQQGGVISGAVRDRSGDVVAEAEVRVQSQETGARQVAVTSEKGIYSTTELAPGTYKITIRKSGFRTISEQDIALTAGKSVRVDFSLDVLPLQQEVTVSAAQSDIDPTASGLTMSRNSAAASLPQNGRDIHALFDMMPGATIAPAAISAGGQFTISGQRPNANSFWVDGVNGNVGMGIVALPGAVAGGNLPGMTTMGGLQSLASKEETERVELRAADFSPEYGDRPGAQINIDTRAGTQNFHGSLFGYVRPHAFDSADWFARGAGVGLNSAFVDGFGGALSGPLGRKHTFFFVSVERAHVKDSALQLIPVPSLITRAQAAFAAYQPIFDAFPQPQGRLLNGGYAVAYSPLATDGSVNNQSIRLDQTIGNHAQLFARFSDVPSSSLSTGVGAIYSAFQWISATAGVNVSAHSFTQEFRFNFSKVQAQSAPGSPDFPSLDAILQTPGLVNFGELRVSMEGAGQTAFGSTQSNATESQFTGAYNIAREVGRHHLRAGLTATSIELEGGSSGSSYSLSIVSPSLAELLSGDPLGVTTSFGAVPGINDRYSGYVEDGVRVSDRLSILAGLRWDLTPPVTNNYPYYSDSFFLGYWRGVGSLPIQLTNGISSSRDANWPVHYGQVAPRLGIAYHLKSPDLVLRAGAGLFYDTGLGYIISNTNPFNIWQFLPETKMPVLGPNPPPLSTPVLALPRVWEWKTSIEKSLGEDSLLSVSYFGSKGDRLLRNEGLVDPQSAVLDALEFTSRGTSNYNALLANVHANLKPNFYTLVSYTWSHSIDTGSSDTTPLLINGPSNKGSSGFDVRQVLSASFGYRVPVSFGRILGGWTVSANTFARTGFPFDVTTVDESIGLGFDNADRANVVTGQPIWIPSSAPGGRVLNPAAFQAPALGAQGSLGRNALAGTGLFQIDGSLRRQIRLYRGSSIEASVSAFNLLNHASFANPVNYLGSALFGQSTSMTNLMLGSGSPTTGLTPLFQAGGPRTVELSLRFSF